MPDDTLKQEAIAALKSLETRLQAIDRLMVKRIQVLRTSIEEDKNVAALVFLDPAGILHPASIEERALTMYQQRPGWFGWLEFLRNFLILVPIALTWFELSRATAAYQQTIALVPEQIDQPFLLLWEQGFPDLPTASVLTFSQLALIDSLVICVIIIMTIFIHYHHDVRYTKAVRKALVVRDVAEQAVWAFGRLCAEYRYRQAHPGLVVAESLETAIRDFAVKADQMLGQFDTLQNSIAWERDHLEKIAARRLEEIDAFERAVQDWQAVPDNLAPAMHELINTHQQIKESVDAFYRYIDQFEALAQLHHLPASINGFTELIHDSNRVLLDRLDGTLDTTKHAVERNETSVRNMTRAVDDMIRSLSSVEKGEDALHQALTIVREDLRQTQKRLDKAAEAFVGIGSSHRAFAENISGLVKNFREEVSRMNNTIGHLDKRIGGFVKSLEHSAAPTSRSSRSRFPVIAFLTGGGMLIFILVGVLVILMMNGWL